MARKDVEEANLSSVQGSLAWKIVALGFMVPHLPEAIASFLGHLGSQALQIFCHWKNIESRVVSARV